MTEHYCDYLVEAERVTYDDYPWVEDINYVPCDKPARFKLDRVCNDGKQLWYCAEHWDEVQKPVCNCGGVCWECV